mmetsp:Transcript_495/g.915  ORF Transcript_495/g.915 Transcript_495/m.915 type:complete len:254 (+) Transcript_495:429-1190(+)
MATTAALWRDTGAFLARRFTLQVPSLLSGGDSLLDPEGQLNPTEAGCDVPRERLNGALLLDQGQGEYATLISRKRYKRGVEEWLDQVAQQFSRASCQRTPQEPCIHQEEDQQYTTTEACLEFWHRHATKRIRRPEAQEEPSDKLTQTALFEASTGKRRKKNNEAASGQQSQSQAQPKRKQDTARRKRGKQPQRSGRKDTNGNDKDEDEDEEDENNRRGVQGGKRDTSDVESERRLLEETARTMIEFSIVARIT